MAQEEYEARIAELEEQVVKLTSENQELEETVQWMHDLIWEILGRRWNLHSVKEQSDAENSTKK